MKNIIYILLILLPVMGHPQQNRYKSSPSDYTWMNVGNPDFSTGEAVYTNLVFNPVDGLPYVAYEDYGNTYKASLVKFDGNNWVNVGPPNFSSALMGCLSFAFSASGEPYVAYDDEDYSWKATVMKFDGTSWVTIGNAGFSAGEVYFISLAISPSGQPYVAYQDCSDGYKKATVMKYDGTNWVNVGNPEFSAGLVLNTRLVFSPSGQPYVSYFDYGNAGKATVMKFNGSNWVNVGNAGFSSGYVYYPDLAFNPLDGQPWLVFGDTYPVYKATVMKFNGTSWVNVGNPSFSAGEADYTRIAFSPSGVPYVAFQDWATNPFGKATVMKFDGADWLYVGDQGFSVGLADWISLAFSPAGQPYVAFEDDTQPTPPHKATVMKYDSVVDGIDDARGSKLLLYPNPVSKFLTIGLKDIRGSLNTIEILDIKGITMFETQTPDNKIVVDVENYQRGIYLVKIKSSNSSYIRMFCKD